MKDINIKSYDADDAFYTGTDEDYEEFLKTVDEHIGEDAEELEEAEPVENTQKINLNETINLQGVIDKFKKTAGGIGQSAKSFKESFKDTMATKMDAMKAKKEETAAKAAQTFEDIKETAEEKLEPVKEKLQDNGISEKLQSSMQSSAKKLDEIKGGMAAMADMPDKVGGVDSKIDEANSTLIALSKQLETLSDKLSIMETSIGDGSRENAESAEGIQNSIKSVGEEITEIRQSIGAVARLNDSIFDLKNTQLNTKNSISNLETAFARLKKKCILGVTVLSILSAIIIALEIFSMLS